MDPGLAITELVADGLGVTFVGAMAMLFLCIRNLISGKIKDVIMNAIFCIARDAGVCQKIIRAKI